MQIKPFVDLTSSPVLRNAAHLEENIDTAQLLNEIDSEFSFNDDSEAQLVIY